MTPRQSEILRAIVETYAHTADPVGSMTVSPLFSYSPATIRAEMVELERLGYITHPHTSAGRVPTDKGYRAYVNHVQPQTSARVVDAISKRVKSAGEPEQAVKVAAETLAEITHNMALATLSGGLFRTGMASLFGRPELASHSQAYEVARLLDNLENWLEEAAPSGPVSVYIGQENPVGKSSGCSLIIARFESPFSAHSYIGVLGPTRQDYDRVIGLVDYAGKLLEEKLHV